jgi:hypothetical protein
MPNSSPQLVKSNHASQKPAEGSQIPCDGNGFGGQCGVEARRIDKHGVETPYHGYGLSDRGRIPSNVIEAFDQAHASNGRPGKKK